MILKYLQFPLKITTNLQKTCAQNQVGLQDVNHLLNNPAHLASRREINDMNNLYNNPPKMKELWNKSTCTASLIYCFNTMLIGSHAVSSHKICSYRLIITARYAVMERMYFKSKQSCDREADGKETLTLTRRLDSVDICFFLSVKLWQCHPVASSIQEGLLLVEWGGLIVFPYD